MDLYKKHGVNPVGGCLPMMIQLPFFIAFYRVLERADRVARRALALGARSFAAGNAGDSHAAADSDRDAVPFPEDDAAARASIRRSRR